VFINQLTERSISVIYPFMPVVLIVVNFLPIPASMLAGGCRCFVKKRLELDGAEHFHNSILFPVANLHCQVTEDKTGKLEQS